ncbi:MAG: LapA family protein [Thermodesulfobacteriota bacterium]|nr:LapA family protein [Thermodesulfobacteriota bacterium]
MRLLKTIFITFLFILAITFATKNLESVTIRYYYFEDIWTTPLFLVVFISVLAGILIAGVVGAYSRFTLKQEVKRHKKKILELEKELNSLRNLPITESKSQDNQIEE